MACSGVPLNIDANDDKISFKHVTVLHKAHAFMFKSLCNSRQLVNCASITIKQTSKLVREEIKKCRFVTMPKYML